MEVWLNVKNWDDSADEHFRAIDAHNWLVAHARTADIGIYGRYMIIRALHHIAGIHNAPRTVDLRYALYRSRR